MRFRSGSNNQKFSYAISILFVIFLTGISMFGQATGVAVTGTVADATAAVIPNAATNIEARIVEVDRSKVDNSKFNVFGRSNILVGSMQYLFANAES